MVTYKQLGRTGLRISPIGVGSVNFSWLTSDEESFAIMDKAHDHGINFFDTANNYNAGGSETVLGKYFAQGGGRRDRTILATKVFSPPMLWASPDPAERMGANAGPNERGLSAKHIRLACEASLKRLNTDYIDIYQMHHVDRLTPWEEIWQAMELLVAQGKVLYVGSSNFAGWQIAKASEIAKQRHFMGLVSEQSVYNLMQRTVELEVLPACREYGMGFFPYSPLASGNLAGTLLKDNVGRRRFTPVSPKVAQKIEQYQQICEEIDSAPSAVAIAWLLKNPVVTAPILGPRTMAQFESALDALTLELDDEVMGKLDELFKGPGGEAPEAYAW